MNDRSTRIRRILSRPELPTGNELAKRLERHRLPETTEQIETGRRPRFNAQQNHEDHS